MVNNSNLIVWFLWGNIALLYPFFLLSTSLAQQAAPFTAISSAIDGTESIRQDKPTEIAIDWTALIGFPIEYQQLTKQFVEKVVELSAGRGKWPMRNYHSLIRVKGIRPRELYERANFPMTAQIGEVSSVPIELLILPDPKMVRAFGSVERDFAELAKKQPIKHPEEWQSSPEGHTHTVTTNVYCVPKNGQPLAPIILPRPKGTESRNDSGLQLLCEYQGRFSYEEYFRFPELDNWKEKMVWQGIVASGLVLNDNPVIRWVSLRSPAEPATKFWVAYSVVDACGALSDKGGGNTELGANYFRPLDKCPFCPTLKMNEEGLRERIADAPSEFGIPRVPTEFNLLRIPTPRELMAKEKSAQWYGADWSLCEEYYSEHKTPAWKLTITNDSKPYRESFCIEHALDDSGQEIWKLVVFATIKPKDLLQVICKLKGIDPNEIQIGELEKAYEELNAVREKLLNK